MSRRGRPQSGVTLVEVLVIVAVSSIVVVPLLAWAVASFRHQDDTTQRNDETAGLALHTTYFQRDVSTAVFARSAAPIRWRWCQLLGRIGRGRPPGAHQR